MDSAGDSVLMTGFLQQADRVFTGCFVMNTHIKNAEFFEEGMHQIMMVGNDDEALRVLLQESDPDLPHAAFADGT